jgi:hypothetical protein
MIEMACQWMTIYAENAEIQILFLHEKVIGPDFYKSHSLNLTLTRARARARTRTTYILSIVS